MPVRPAAPFLLLPLLLASPVVFSLAHAAPDTAAAPVADAGQLAPPAKPGAETSVVEVKGQAGAYDARRNDTATKIVVTQEDILRNGDTSIGEVLKRLPGVTVGGVQGRGGDIRMRGLGSGYTQVMLNGEPSPPGFSLDQLSPDMIERIEIMRAATAEYSTQAIAGAINIVLKKAIVTAQRELKAGLQDDHGRLGTNVNFQLSDRKGPLSYAMGGGLTYAHFDRPSEVITAGSDALGHAILLRDAAEASHGHFEALNLSPRVNWTLGPGDVLTSQSFVAINRFGARNSELVDTRLGAPPMYSGTVVNIDSRSEMLRTDLTWTRKLGQGAKLDLKAGVNYNRRETTAPSAQYFADDTLALNRLITSNSTDKGATGSGKYSMPLGEGHALAFGWDAGYSLRDEDRFQRETSTGRAPAVNLDQVFTAKVGRLALFAQDEWTVTQQWSVYAGVRWEGIDTRSEGLDYAAVDNRSSVWSPVFQTLWKLPGSKNDQVRLGITRTYKAPSVNSLIPRRFASNNNSQTSPDSQGNPLLRPELAWGLDLAFEHYLPNGGLLTASTFARRINDITHSHVTQIDRLWVSMPFNDGVANTRGVELEAKVPLRSVWKTAPAIEMRANLARNWSTLTTVPGPNNRLDQQTPFSGTVGLDYKLDNALTVGGSYSFQNGGPVRISQNQFAYSVPKRSLDMYALCKFSAKQQLRISLSNALHQDNLAETSYVLDGATQRETTLTPTTVVLRAMLELKL